jgi:invasion protein IalB
MRHLAFSALAVTALVFASTAFEAHSQAKKPAPAKKKGAEPAATAGPKKIATHGKWEVYVQGGKTKLCYATTKPQKRTPANLKDVDGYVFISTRPAQNVRNEIAIKMGFDLKPDAKPTVTIGAAKFAMVANGTNLFVEIAAEERSFVAAMRKGSELVVRATSKRGNDTTDNYTLSGIGKALDELQKECK